MVTIERKSGVYVLRAEQVLNTQLDVAWEFFSNPSNLQKITPKELDFEIVSIPGEQMREGDIITYRIGIFPLVKTNWVTEIKSVIDLNSFIDEQRFGPYTFWHHRHTFQQNDNGVLMVDEIHFRPPFWIFSKFTINLFLAPKLKKIFAFRALEIEKYFTT